MPKKGTYTYPPSLPMFRLIWKANALRKDPIYFHRKFFSTYGDTFSFRLRSRKRFVLSRDKEVVQHILQKNHKNYYKSALQTFFLSKYLGNGLLTVNGDFWLKQRRLIQPAFHKQKIERLVGGIQKTIVGELNDLKTGKPIDVYPVMNHLAFRIVANSLFEVSISEEVLHRLQFIIEKIQNFLIREIRLPHLGWWFRLNGLEKKHIRLAQETRTIIRGIIEERKESREDHEDLLDMLLETRYEDTGAPMPTEQLIDEIAILFVAGHETTANALSFTLFLLAKHPEICEKVYAEVARVDIESDALSEKIKSLEYTRAIIDESMRLYPPAWITDRENLKDDTVQGYHMEAGTLIGVSFFELHRHPKYWDHPETFSPERFMGANRKKTTGVFYPFGAGPRMCIGMGFAVYEMVLAIAHIVKRYRLSTTRNEVGFNPLVTLKPIGAEVTFEPR